MVILDICARARCDYGGTCVAINNTNYKCECSIQTYGKHCESTYYEIIHKNRYQFAIYYTFVQDPNQLCKLLYNVVPGLYDWASHEGVKSLSEDTDFDILVDELANVEFVADLVGFNCFA